MSILFRYPNFILFLADQWKATPEDLTGMCFYYLQNFLALSASGFYSGCPFHRNIKGFMVQTGDPTGNGCLMFISFTSQSRPVRCWPWWRPSVHSRELTSLCCLSKSSSSLLSTSCNKSNFGTMGNVQHCKSSVTFAFWSSELLKLVVTL